MYDGGGTYVCACSVMKVVRICVCVHERVDLVKCVCVRVPYIDHVIVLRSPHKVTKCTTRSKWGG